MTNDRRWPPAVLMTLCLWVVLAAALASVRQARSEEPTAEPGILLSPRMQALASMLNSSDGAREVAAFWSEVEKTGTPLVERVAGKPERVLMTFLWHGRDDEESSNVGVAGLGRSSFERSSDRLTRLRQTRIWYRTYEVESDARFQYYLMWPQSRSQTPGALERYAADDGIQYEYFKDPLSKRSVPFDDGESLSSYAEGPDAPPEPWIDERSDVARGTTVTFEMHSTVLGNSRNISVYQPARFRTCGRACPFVLAFDRDPYLHTLGVPHLLDNMIAAAVVPPMIAIMVGNVERDVELPANPRFARYIAEELVPSLRKNYGLTRDPRQAVIAGASYGGLASAFIARAYPNVFGNVLSQSGSYWWYPGVDLAPLQDSRASFGWLSHQYSTEAKLPLRFYLDVGIWEGADMVAPNRQFRDVLRARGYEVSYREFVGPHTYLNWRATFPEALMALVGTAKGRALLRQQRIFHD